MTVLKFAWASGQPPRPPNMNTTKRDKSLDETFPFRDRMFDGTKSIGAKSNGSE